jgi:hypothetical protein
MKRKSSIIVKNVNEITTLPKTRSQRVREAAVMEAINPSRYQFLGFVEGTTNVRLKARFHNVRDSLGRFATA